jgi:preprotein translocase subunit SecY
MNERNEIDQRNYVFNREYIRLLFLTLLTAFTIVSIVFVQSGHRNTLKTKEKQEFRNFNEIGRTCGLALLVKARQTYIHNRQK